MDYQTLLAQYLAAQQQSNPTGAPELNDPFRGYNLADGSGVQMHNGSIDYIPLGAKAGNQYTTYGADGSTTNGTIKDGHSFLDPLFNALPMAVPGLIAGGTMAGAGMFGDPSSLFSASSAGSGASGFPIAQGAATGMPAVGGDLAATSGASGAFGSAASGGGESMLGNEFANETAKFAAQNAAAPGSLMSTSLPTISTGGGMFEGLLDSIPQGVKDFAGSKLGGALAGSLLGGIGGSSKTGDMTTTNQQQIDPRMASILYGANGNNGFLSQLLAQANSPQSAGMNAFGQGASNFLGTQGAQSLQSGMDAAGRLQASNLGAPSMSAAQAGQTPGMSAANVNAPSQNGVDLSGAYKDMVYGQAGNNPYLTGAIQKGINQSNNAFGNMMTDSTRNLTQSILPSIRSGALVNGQMGSSRQGIAEGMALNDYSTQMGRAMSQFGQNNTDAAVSAQAGAYDADRNRSLSAMSGLGAQQYGVAQQDAQMQQQANMNNYQGALQTNLTNAGYQQGANQANLSSQLGTNQLNSQNQVNGINAGAGLLSNAYNYGTNQDAYNLNKVGKVSGLLSPYTGLGSGNTTTQPLYENKVGGLLNGAMIGASIFGGSNKQNG